MATSKRATVYFEPEIHKALRLKAVATESTVSQIVNEAVKLSLREDAEDLEALAKAQNEPLLNFEDVVHDMKRRGLI